MVFCGLYYIESQINQLNGLSAWTRNPGPTEISGNFVLVFSSLAFSAQALTTDLLIVFNYFSFSDFVSLIIKESKVFVKKRPLSEHEEKK